MRMTTKFLVTGGLGFIGSHLCEYILRQNANNIIINVDSDTYAGNPNNISHLMDSGRLIDLHADVRDKELVTKIFKDWKPHYVFHAAAESHVDNSITAPGVFMETNVLGTFNVLEACREYMPRKTVYFSTDEVMGSTRDGYFDEQSQINPSSVYSASKATGDMLGQAYFTTYGLPICIVRPTNNYGIHQHPEKLIPRFISNLSEHAPVPVYGDGKQVRTWLAVEDCVDAIYRVALEGCDGEIYCIGSNVELENIYVTKKILEYMERDESYINYVDDRPGHDFRYAVDSSKIRNRLGWNPSFDTVEAFDKHLEYVVQWYCKNKGHWR